MSFVFGKYWERLLKEIAACEMAIREIESDLRIRAMSNDANDRELGLLRRLKDEKADFLYRSQNLKEAFIALLGENDIAIEGVDSEGETNDLTIPAGELQTIGAPAQV
ncbi:hypothetical protein [Agrobacterium fabrum]|uniref:hypothetical protein n=1 Tax=Agrobacterium fabrum TaxID=1176649 RepID=UPI001FCD5EB8|nr:hypothetical protein [Agrobacterium fabrum]